MLLDYLEVQPTQGSPKRQNLLACIGMGGFLLGGCLTTIGVKGMFDLSHLPKTDLLDSLSTRLKKAPAKKRTHINSAQNPTPIVHEC